MKFLRHRIFVPVATVAVLLMLLGGDMLVGAHGGSLSLIHSCVDVQGKVRITDENAGCRSNEIPLDWPKDNSGLEAGLLAVENYLSTIATTVATLQTELAAEIAARVQGDQTTLASANVYADQEIADEASIRQQADSTLADSLASLESDFTSYQSLLGTAGILNASTNPIDWTQLKNVPSSVVTGPGAQDCPTHQYAAGTKADGSLVCSPFPIFVFVPATAGGASVPLQATGITLKSGQTATLTASGTGYYCPGCPIGPDGSGAGSTCPECIAPDLPSFSLIGKIGDGPFFFVGSGPVSVAGSGRLRLGFNDWVGTYDNNSDGFQAVISVK